MASGDMTVQSRPARAARTLGGRDPEFIRRTLPVWAGLVSKYFRADVRGLEHVPDRGPVLLVGNHSGGNVPPDTFVLALALISRFGIERPFYQLAHDLVMVSPVAPLLRRYGTLRASRANAREALEAGAAVLVYPGGDYETHRPSWESGTVDFDHREGFLTLAHELDVPIVPVVSIGGQETALFLTRGEGLAHLLGLDRALRLKVLPISLALPWGLNVGDLLGHVPLPAKVSVRALAPIDLRATYGDDPDFDMIYDDVLALMQRELTALSATRRLPVLG
jgi:1-acyl-sn-glycerol-3-phosphate acyltransferase